MLIKAPHYWPFVKGFYRWPVDSPHKRLVMRTMLWRHQSRLTAIISCYQDMPCRVHGVMRFLDDIIWMLCEHSMNLLNSIQQYTGVTQAIMRISRQAQCLFNCSSNKENINAPHWWPFVRGTSDRWFPLQIISNAESADVIMIITVSMALIKSSSRTTELCHAFQTKSNIC